MTIIKIQTTNITEFDTETGKSKVSTHYSKILGVGTNAKKKIKKTVKTKAIEEEYL